MRLKDRAKAVANSPWSYASSDISAVLLELLSALEEQPMTYRQACEVLRSPSLYSEAQKIEARMVKDLWLSNDRLEEEAQRIDALLIAEEMGAASERDLRRAFKWAMAGCFAAALLILLVQP